MISTIASILNPKGWKNFFIATLIQTSTVIQNLKNYGQLRKRKEDAF